MLGLGHHGQHLRHRLLRDGTPTHLVNQAPEGGVVLAAPKPHLLHDAGQLAAGGAQHCCHSFSCWVAAAKAAKLVLICFAPKKQG